MDEPLHDDADSGTSLPERPRLRRVEGFPVSQPSGETLFALRDPEGFSGSIVLPYQAAVLVSLMDGNRTLADLCAALKERLGHDVAAQDVEQVVRDLDQRFYLDNARFRARWKREIETYLNLRVRPAAHAGGGYPADPDELRRQLGELVSRAGEANGNAAVPTAVEDVTAGSDDSAASTRRLCAVLSPHMDFRRGGLSLAWAQQKIVEQSDAELFVILGTGHNPMRQLFAATKKDFATPLGTVETDRKFVARLAARAAALAGDGELNLLADELAHRQEHSIEFQVVMLQYLLGGKRPLAIVPILVGSFHEFVAQHASPADSPQVKAFVQALRETVAADGRRTCYISSGDLAHIGQRFGDRQFLDAARLQEQTARDRTFLEAACRADADALVQLIAAHHDRDRVCGLSPTYTMLAAARPTSGELLRYDQAVELDGTSCVSFASAAFYCE
ncbi:MAG: AmmeMemoRadiSam system protein B [Pirellulales bacterium]